jgi:hypothetical protein
VPADYDNDGMSDYAIWRPTTGVWMIIKSTDSTYSYKTLGIAGDQAIESAYTKQVAANVPGDVMGPLRLKPTNATGGTNLYSQNFGWGTSLFNLPGRSGFNAGFGISYNSLVWIKSESSMYFDPDHGNVSPGFRFGFPSIDPIYYDSTTAKWTYLMVAPDGGRKEFRQIGAGNVFESADSSYAQLVQDIPDEYFDPNAPPENVKMTVFTTDGTKLRYEWMAGGFRCTRITDRNGNYIKMAYDQDFGVLLTVTDTLGRVITIGYDSQSYPTTITQTWKENNGAGTNTTTHTWASFTYATETVSTSFSGLTNLGPPNGTVIKVLDKITNADGSYTKFHYNGYIQVEKIENFADDDHLLNHVRTSIEGLNSQSAAQSDCPRFLWTKTYAENFKSGSEVTIDNTAPASDTFTAHGGSESSSMVKVTVSGHPTSGFNTKTHYGPSGYKEGLIIGTEDCLSTSNCTGTNRVRWMWTSWTQDNTGVSYITNPRVTETQVGDGTNTKKTTIEYYTSGGTYPYGLPEKITVGDLSSIKKTQKIFYNLNANYTGRRIIGLPAEKYLYEGPDSGPLMSKVTYTYDDYTSPEPALTDLSSPVQQCRTTSADCPSAYGTSFTYRGNLTTTTRCDATYPTSCTNGVSSSTAYNIAGSPVSSTDPRGRVSTISYTDSWNDSVSRTTYAYPTTVTDPGNNSSTIKYRYDFGANVEANSPAPSGQTYGKKTKRTFDDDIGRITRQSVYVNTTEKAYTRYQYFDSANHYKTFTPLVDLDNDGYIAEDEVETETWIDGAGRVIKSKTENPDSIGGYTGKQVVYDILGRVIAESVPTEMSTSWTTGAGDDASRGWIWNSKEYDWKGRVTRIIPSDSNGSDGKDTLMEYSGCGCAGGQVTTIKGPVTTAMDASGATQTTKRRWQKVYEDILGRTDKAELWDLDGAGMPNVGGPYTTTKTTFNGRDQATLIRRYVGADTSSTYQDTTMTYDGHGRVLQKHLPEESGTTPYTAYTYKADDMVATVTDANGSVKTFFYGELDSHGSEDRALLTKISYVPGSGLEDVADVTFSYDAAGNRTQMAEDDSNWGTGTTNYYYDELSRITSETKTFPSTWSLPDSPGSGSRTYTITYNYFLNGSVKKVVDPFGYDIDYTVDKVGRMKTVTGDAFGDTSVTQYIDDVDYRAWGAEKQIDFDNDLTLTQTFDNRLRLLTHRLDRQGYTDHLLDKTYTYLPDGKLGHSTEGSISRVDSSDFERSYVYDFAARIREARTSYEARNQNPQEGDKLPYHLDYEYDAFDHNTERSGTIWFGEETPDHEEQTWSASTNKVSGWLYDAAGNTTYSVWNRYPYAEPSSQTYTFNAAGTTTSAWQNNHSNSLRELDGMQRPIHIAQSGNRDNYLIYSTVFGKVLMETNATGAKRKTYVHDLGGSIIAVQQINYIGTQQFAQVRWDHTDPSGASYMQTFNDGSLVSDTSAELDPTDRAVKMFSGETEEEVSPFGNEDACKGKDDTPENCTAKPPKPKEKCKDGDWTWDGEQWVCVKHRDMVNVVGESDPWGQISQDNEDFEKWLDKVYATPACDVAKYEDLSPGQKALIDPDIYTNPAKFPKGLNQLERAGFVNITGALEAAGVDLAGLKLQQAGVRSDRLLFAPGSTDDFRKSIKAGTKANPPTFNPVGLVARQFGGHGGMNDYMVRQNVGTNSLQVGFGDDGAFADIDLFNPQPQFKNESKHWAEIRKNDGDIVTPHFYLAKVLGNCK